MPHLACSTLLNFLRLKIADDPKETRDRIRVPKVARVLIALRFASAPQAAKVVDLGIPAREPITLSNQLPHLRKYPRWGQGCWRGGGVGG
jgi:hypothetical protein